MDFVRDDLRMIYRKYAAASIGSALAMSIYSMIDTVAVGHSVGAIGTAAMAVVTPVYGTQAFIASLCGVGGSVLMTKEKAQNHVRKGNEYFTASLLLLSLMRGFVLSGALILVLPLLIGLNGIMAAIVAAEGITAVTGLVMISRGTWVHSKDIRSVTS